MQCHTINITKKNLNIYNRFKIIAMIKMGLGL